MVGYKWHEVMYKAILSQGYSSVIFFIFLVLIGNFIMLNLFLAILLGNFEHASMIVRVKNEDIILNQLLRSNNQEFSESSSTKSKVQEVEDNKNVIVDVVQQRNLTITEKMEMLEQKILSSPSPDQINTSDEKKPRLTKKMDQLELSDSNSARERQSQRIQLTPVIQASKTSSHRKTQVLQKGSIEHIISNKR